MLAALYNVPVDPVSWAQFSFHNRDEHDLAAIAIREQKDVTINAYILDPIPPNDPGLWLRSHQNSHNEINTALGTAGNDLSAVDIKNPGQVENWIQNHASEHRAWCDILGIP